MNLATSGLPHVPVAFKIPDKKVELIEYVSGLFDLFTDILLLKGLH